MNTKAHMKIIRKEEFMYEIDSLQIWKLFSEVQKRERNNKKKRKNAAAVAIVPIHPFQQLKMLSNGKMEWDKYKTSKKCSKFETKIALFINN